MSFDVHRIPETMDTVTLTEDVSYTLGPGHASTVYKGVSGHVVDAAKGADGTICLVQFSQNVPLILWVHASKLKVTV